MLAIVGTIPDLDFPVVAGEVTLREGRIWVAGRSAPVNRGTPALIAAAIKCLEVLGLPMPYGYLAGDIGLGGDSRRLYDRLVKDLPSSDFRALTFHYLQPDVDWHNKILFAIGQIRRRPILIADAGFLYAAKMCGLAEDYDVFTNEIPVHLPAAAGILFQRTFSGYRQPRRGGRRFRQPVPGRVYQTHGTLPLLRGIP